MAHARIGIALGVAASLGFLAGYLLRDARDGTPPRSSTEAGQPGEDNPAETACPAPGDGRELADCREALHLMHRALKLAKANVGEPAPSQPAQPPEVSAPEDMADPAAAAPTTLQPLLTPGQPRRALLRLRPAGTDQGRATNADSAAGVRLPSDAADVVREAAARATKQHAP